MTSTKHAPSALGGPNGGTRAMTNQVDYLAYTEMVLA